jgi:hypothetical protein
MVLDTIDALEHPAAYEEFILLSADTDLSPVLIRLRAHNRSTAIYANAVTAESYKAIADAMVDEQRLISLLLTDEEPGAEEQASGPPAERSEVEALARKISAATNVPLFAPRTFAELFRHLVEEIAENGYHFQSTAENVATRMAGAGRNVTRRQVVFVVKGLALKGHVFSTSDTPERLAEVFREQVLYLAENGGLTLDEKEKSVLPSWIVGRAPPASPGTPQETEIQPAPATAETPASNGRATGKSPDDQPGRSRRKQPKVTIAPRAEAAPPPAPKPAAEAAKPVAEVAAKPAPPAPKPEPRPVPARVSVGEKAPQPPPRSPTATPRPLINPVKPNPAATSPTPAATPRPAPPLAAGARPPPVSTPRTPPTTRPAAPTSAASDADKEAVESSILAAIAQAVDVLVEDSGGKSKGSAPTPPKSSSAAPPEKKPPTPPPAEEEVPSEGDDIGDEIQRIIASYNRNRGQDERR